MLVKVARTTTRVVRTSNGAWYPTTQERQDLTLDEDQLDSRFSLNSGIRVTWPDGVTESAFPFNGGACPGYPPTCIPADGRLAKLLNR